LKKMKLRYGKNLQPAVDGMQKISALAWSHNGSKLAVSTADRVVHLYDDMGERRDKFPTKPAEKGQKSYIIRALAFSPDSTKIAVAQSDNIVFVYKLGTEWGEKKTICNKYQQSSSVTCMCWHPSHANDFVFGLAEGKVKVAVLKKNTANPLYSTEAYVVSVAMSKDGETVISGHLDGAIYRYVSSTQQHTLLISHTSAPYALDMNDAFVCAAGNDGKVIFYEGSSVYNRFDYSSDHNVKEFTIAAFNPSGDSVVLGNFNRFFIFQYNQKRRDWMEADIKVVENLYSVTALCWKPDGSKLVLGSLCGSVDMFEACQRKVKYKGRYEFTYVSSMQVNVKDLSTGQMVGVKTEQATEITKINIYLNRYLVANTAMTMLLGDLDTTKISEVAWRGFGKEKFEFSNPGVCMIFHAGEVTLVEYGANDILGSFRTEQLKPNLISARLSYSKGVEGAQATKLIAYLLDPQTLSVLDLNSGMTTATITHDSKIDFLELNSSSTKLLFRDKRRQLHLFNIRTQNRSTLLNYCNYAQWVPRSDVLVAQSRTNMNVWYNIDDPDKVSVYVIKGDIEEIERLDGKTDVVVNEGANTVTYTLDEPLIELGSAMESGEFDKVVQTLEPVANSPESEANWKALAKSALQQRNLQVAEQCFAALGDVSKARFVHKILKLAEKHQAEHGQSGLESVQVRARLAMLEKQFTKAETILLEQNELQEVFDMYEKLHRWDDLISVAERHRYDKLTEMRANYFQWLLQSNQEEKAADVREREGDYIAAINLYLKAKLPARAAAVVNKYNYTQSREILEKIANVLQTSDLHEKAGEFFEKLGETQKALQSYVAGNGFRKAVDLARRTSPQMVQKLEEQWGDYLVSQKQMDASINHFMEANQVHKAIEASINARQWSKAVQLLGSQPPDVTKPYYRQIGKHYAEVRQLEQAEKFFLKAGAISDAFDMYTSNNRWDAAYKFACQHMQQSEVTLLYIKQAQKLEAASHLKEAEKMYLTVNEPDLAINMYRKLGQQDHVFRLMGKHRKELLKEAHLQYAQQLLTEGKTKEAEQHFIEAGEWKVAIDKYSKSGQWEDALRLVKTYGGPKDIEALVRDWARLEGGGEQGSQLLLKQGLVEAALDYEVEKKNFNKAFELAETSCRHKLPHVRLHFAMHLEDQNRLKDAEDQYILAGKPAEAVNMYEHQMDFHSALRVAKQYDQKSVPTILVAQGKHLLQRGDIQKAEQCFVTAKQPELAIEAYLKSGNRNEAIRVSREYAPHLMDRVLRMAGQAQGAEENRQRAKIYEQQGDYGQAIQAYLSITPEMTSNYDLLEECWERAANLAMTYDKENAQQITVMVSKQLAAVGRFEVAAEMYAGIGKYEDAVKCYIALKDFQKAKALCASIKQGSLATQLANMIDKAQRDDIMTSGNTGALVDLDPQGGINLLMEQKKWEQALENAKFKSPQMLNQVLFEFSKSMLNQGHVGEAVKTFTIYGTPVEKPFLMVYKTLSLEVFAECSEEEVYDLRLMLKSVVEAMSMSRETAGFAEMEHFLRVSQYLYLKTICKNKGLRSLYTKICVSLLRYTNEIRVDKAFYEAGIACREEGWLNMAFIFLNRYLDLNDAISDSESGGAALADTTDFEGTDIPMDITSLPETNMVSTQEAEGLRDFLLQLSVDQKLDKRLSTRRCDCGREIYVGNLVCPFCEASWSPCVVTGFPVLRASAGACTNCNQATNRPDWNSYIVLNQSCPWCASIQSQAY